MWFRIAFDGGALGSTVLMWFRIEVRDRASPAKEEEEVGRSLLTEAEAAPPPSPFPPPHRHMHAD